MKKRIALSLLLALTLFAPGCGGTAAQAQPTPAPTQVPETAPAPTATPGAAPEEESPAWSREAEEENMEKSLRLAVNGTEIPVDWEENESVEALIELVSAGGLTVPMSMYGGFEQVGPLGTALPRDDRETVTGPGDIVLYAGDRIVVFYGSNSWAYTRLGKIADRSPAVLTALLGNGGVTITLSWE